MPQTGDPEFLFPDEDTARRFGVALGHCLRPGHTLLLDGPLGAGKSHVARAAIRALAGEATEVPSPTFTLVQTYDGPDSEIWHADLYRLTAAHEAEELGLTEAMGRAIVLVEWPDRLGNAIPPDAMRLKLTHAGEARRARLEGASPSFLACLAQALAP